MFMKWKRKLSAVMAVIMLITLLPATCLKVQAETVKTMKLGNGTLEQPYVLVDGKQVEKPVVKISKIEDIKNTIKIKSAFSMPATVIAAMSDNTKKEFAVKWDKKLTAAKKGTFKAYGTVAGYSKKVIYTLVVADALPKMGTIDIPKVTDPSLKKPTDLKLGIREGNTYPPEGGTAISVKNTMPSLLWTDNAVEADAYIICIYDQYKQKKYQTYYGIGDKSSNQGYFDLSMDENFTIGTITVTPINSVDGSMGGGAASNDKIGETAVFECQVDITQKEGKSMTLKATPTEWSKEHLNLTLSDKVSPNAYFKLTSSYQINNEHGKQNKTSGFGSYSWKDGSIQIASVEKEEYNDRYNNPTSKIKLIVFSNPVVFSDTKASLEITVHPITCNDKKVAPQESNWEGVYKKGKRTIVITKGGKDPEYFAGDIHIVHDFGDGSAAFFHRTAKFDSANKITDQTINADGPVITVEMVLEGDIIHYKRIFHQQNNYTEKIDFKKTSENALKLYEKYIKK